jgi:hypothetical protein
VNLPSIATTIAGCVHEISIVNVKRCAVANGIINVSVLDLRFNRHSLVTKKLVTGKHMKRLALTFFAVMFGRSLWFCLETGLSVRSLRCVGAFRGTAVAPGLICCHSHQDFDLDHW